MLCFIVIHFDTQGDEITINRKRDKVDREIDKNRKEKKRIVLIATILLQHFPSSLINVLHVRINVKLKREGSVVCGMWCVVKCGVW